MHHKIVILKRKKKKLTNILHVVTCVKEEKGKIFITFYSNENLLLCFHCVEEYCVKFLW